MSRYVYDEKKVRKNTGFSLLTAFLSTAGEERKGSLMKNRVQQVLKRSYIVLRFREIFGENRSIRRCRNSFKGIKIHSHRYNMK